MSVSARRCGLSTACEPTVGSFRILPSRVKSLICRTRDSLNKFLLFGGWSRAVTYSMLAWRRAIVMLSHIVFFKQIKLNLLQGAGEQSTVADGKGRFPSNTIYIIKN